MNDAERNQRLANIQLIQDHKDKRIAYQCLVIEELVQQNNKLMTQLLHWSNNNTQSNFKAQS